MKSQLQHGWPYFLKTQGGNGESLKMMQKLHMKQVYAVTCRFAGGRRLGADVVRDR